MSQGTVRTWLSCGRYSFAQIRPARMPARGTGKPAMVVVMHMRMVMAAVAATILGDGHAREIAARALAAAKLSSSHAKHSIRMLRPLFTQKLLRARSARSGEAIVSPSLGRALL